MNKKAWSLIGWAGITATFGLWLLFMKTVGALYMAPLMIVVVGLWNLIDEAQRKGTE